MLCNLYNSWIIISDIIFFSIQDVYAFSSYMDNRLQRSIKYGYESVVKKGSYLYQSHNKLNLMIDDVCWQEIILNKKKWLIPACILSNWTAAVSQAVNIIMIW